MPVLAVFGEGAIRAKRAVYAEHDVTLSNEETMDEIVADFPGKLLTDEGTIRSMASTDRSFAKKIMDIIRDVAQRIKEALGWADPTMDRAAQLWENALRAAEKQAGKSQKNTAQEGGGKYSFKGYDEDSGRGIYEGNFPVGTLKSAKAERIHGYIQNVWSKTPINLIVKNEDGTTRTIQAQFDPTYDPSGNTPSDASKLMGGNRHGSHAEQRVTLDLADDYYQIASEAKFNYSKAETGKETATHQNVKQWHYFVNDILFQEYGKNETAPYRVTINVKERDDGQFVYSFNAERQNERPSTRRTLHADVNQAGNTDEANAQPFKNSIPPKAYEVNSKFSISDGERLRSVAEDLRNQMKRTDKPKTDAKAVRAVAADLLEGFESQMDKGDLAGRLKSLYDRISGDRDISYSDMMDEAVDVAREVVEGSLRQSNELYEQYGGLRQELKGKKISVAREHRGDLDAMGGYDAFRKDHAGQFKLTDNGVPVDSVYEDLSARYPELFPEDLISPADRLLRIADDRPCR